METLWKSTISVWGHPESTYAGKGGGGLELKAHVYSFGDVIPLLKYEQGGRESNLSVLTLWMAPIVSGDSPKTILKLCLSTKFPHQEIR